MNVFEAARKLETAPRRQDAASILYPQRINPIAAARREGNGQQVTAPDYEAEIARLKEENSKLKAEHQGAAVKVAVADPPRGLPPGWVEHFDETGAVYYGNTLTQQTSWTKPTVTSVHV